MSTMNAPVQQAVEVDRAGRMESVVRQRGWIFFAIKGFVSGALIYWILKGTSLMEIFASIQSTNTVFFLLAVSSHFLGYLIKANRWRILLAIQGISASVSFLVKSCMVAAFLNNFLPSTFGGDAVRAYDSWRVGRDKPGAVVVILMDRFLGILTLMLFALIALVFSREITARLPLLYVWVLLAIGIMLLAVWVIQVRARGFSNSIRKSNLVLLRKLSRIVDKVLGAFRVFPLRYISLVKALGLSIVFQTNVVVSYYFLARSMGFEIPFHSYFLIVPLAILIMMIPISINGIGIRENTFVFFLAIFGISKSEAIGFAWLAYAIGILYGILGAIVYATRK